MKELNQESKDFIKWSTDYISNDLKYWTLVIKSTYSWLKFCFQDRATIKREIMDKLYKGGLEHGSPTKYTWDEVYREINLEHVDKFGWLLIGIYCEKLAVDNTRAS